MPGLTETLAVGLMIMLGLLILGIWSARAKARGIVVPLYVVLSLGGLGVFWSVGLFSPDAASYHAQAEAISEAWSGESSFTPELSVGKEGWPIMLAAVYFLLGPYPSVGIVLNCFFVAATLLVTSLSARELGADNIAVSQASGILVFSFYSWGLLPLRDPVIWFALATLILVCLKLVRRSSLRLIATLILAAAALLTLRGSLAIPILAFLLVAVAFSAGRALAKFAAVLAAAVLAPAAYRFAESGNYFDSDRVERSQEVLEGAGSGFDTSNLAITSLRVLAGPFPQELVGMSVLYALDWASWMVLLVLSLIALKSVRDRRILIFVGVAAVVLIGLALTSGNYGTMIRIRAMAAVALLPLAGVALQRIGATRRDTSARPDSLGWIMSPAWDRGSC